MGAKRFPVDDNNFDVALLSNLELFLPLNRSSLDYLSSNLRPPALKLTLPVFLESVWADNERWKWFFSLLLQTLKSTDSLCSFTKSWLVCQ